MSALESMIKKVVDKSIAQDYPFAKNPAVLYATVTKATQLGETFSYDDLVIHNDERGTSSPTGMSTRSRSSIAGGMSTRNIRLSPTSAPGYSSRPGPLFPWLWPTGTSRRSSGR